MKAAGIIAEYNPFHEGHKHQIDILRNKMGFDCIVAVMSPCVVQRGELAIFPTDVRVRAALKSGVDLVVELPAPYACMSAEGFARAGVQLLASLGGVQVIAFGSETGSTQDIIEAKNALSGHNFEQLISENLSNGMEYAKAISQAASVICPQAGKVLSTPNNMLGIAYCRAINELNANIAPLALRREGAKHDENIINSVKIQSATAIRELIRSGNTAAFYNAVPLECELIYKKAIDNGEIICHNKFEIAALSRLRAMTCENFAQIRMTNEGLEHRLENAVQKACTLEELYSYLKCRRYSHARMRRLVIDSILNYNQKIPQDVPYVHVLGATQTGIGLIKIANAFGALPVSPSLSELKKHSRSARIVALASERADNFAALCLQNPRMCGTSYTSFMIKC